MDELPEKFCKYDSKVQVGYSGTKYFMETAQLQDNFEEDDDENTTNNQG